ncbi:hypothetical protein HOLleu_03548 [Holothuria leucospilota]|uniref:Fibrinogen C-terminal domain-containing protein n=1 Tax=Holothuria leucospilota TaxID=206669 RepID=A0A9Q1CS41_HOLLE|nr:hypothetical protein HOLleu_03548 [Holothuria leucospilota]
MNTTNVTEQIISNKSTLQPVSSHVTSNFQNGSGTSNLESSSYLTSNHQTVSPSSSVQSFLSFVTSESQTVSDTSARQSISSELDKSIDRTSAVFPSSLKTSEPPKPAALSSLSPSSSVQSFLSFVTSESQTVSYTPARRSISAKPITTIEPTATSIPSSPNTSEPQPQANLPTTNLFQCSCTNDSVPDGTTCKRPTDCDDVYQSCNQSDGVYTIKPKDWQGSAFDVYCNMDESGGWTVGNTLITPNSSRTKISYLFS